MTDAQRLVLDITRARLGDDAAAEVAASWERDGVGADAPAERVTSRAELAQLAAWRTGPWAARRRIAIERLARLGYEVTCRKLPDDPAEGLEQRAVGIDPATVQDQGPRS